VGPKSCVVLDTPYLSDRVRLGVGARGSLFVFKRLSEDNAAATAWIEDYSHKPIQGRAFGLKLLLLTGMMFSFTKILPSQLAKRHLIATTLTVLQKLFRLLIVPLACIGGALSLGKGGIVEDDVKELRSILGKS
jgi:hypothetical protein